MKTKKHKIPKHDFTEICPICKKKNYFKKLKKGKDENEILVCFNCGNYMNGY